MYRPDPRDTSAIELSADVEALVEHLAENAHEVWASARIAAGWQWGPARDDAGLRHPCLVPYAELPEAEKDYDRRAARETLKLIIACGYRLETSR